VSNHLDEDLRAVLVEHAGDAPPPDALLGAVHARSRRVAVHRKAAMAGTTAAVAAIALATAPLVAGHGGASPPVTIGAGSPTNAAPVAVRGQITVPFRAGSVPAGWYPQVWPMVVNGVGTLRLESPDPGVWLTLAVYDPAGGQPGQLGDMPDYARVSVDRDATHRVLAFGPGVSTATLRQVARGVDVHTPTAVTFPYRLGYLPGGLYPFMAAAAVAHVGFAGDAAGDSGTPVTYRPPAMSSRLALTDRAHAASNDYAVTIEVAYTGGKVTRKYGSPDTTFAGHRARVVVYADATVQVTLFDVFPRHVVTANAAGSVGRAGLERVLRALHPVGDVNDFGSWIANPLPR
jgi:hypothetical protein